MNVLALFSFCNTALSRSCVWCFFHWLLFLFLLLLNVVYVCWFFFSLLFSRLVCFMPIFHHSHWCVEHWCYVMYLVDSVCFFSLALDRLVFVCAFLVLFPFTWSFFLSFFCTVMHQNSVWICLQLLSISFFLYSCRFITIALSSKPIFTLSISSKFRQAVNYELA